MPSILQEKTMSFAEASKWLPRGRENRPIAFSTIARWARSGVMSRAGKMVKLETLRIGAKWLTSEEALTRFIEKLNEPALEEVVA